MPERIQRRRTKGWRMPVGAVYVGRPTVWGNPFTVGDDMVASAWHWQYVDRADLNGWTEVRIPMTTQSAVDAFRQLMLTRTEASDEQLEEDAVAWQVALDELRGRDLACWCPLDQPCHADVLLEVANR